MRGVAGTLSGILLLFALIMVGCASKEDLKIFDLSKEVSNSYKVAAGQEFIVSLSGNPSTGYSWFYNISDSTILKVLDAGYAKGDNSTKLVGAPSVYRIKFLAVSVGDAEVSFVYKRSFEDNNNAKILKCNFEVLPKE